MADLHLLAMLLIIIVLLYASIITYLSIRKFTKGYFKEFYYYSLFVYIFLFFASIVHLIYEIKADGPISLMYSDVNFVLFHVFLVLISIFAAMSTILLKKIAKIHGFNNVKSEATKGKNKKFYK